MKTSILKKITSFLLAAAVLSGLSLIMTNAFEEITLNYHNNAGSENDIFKTVTLASGSKPTAFYDIPESKGKIFEGWYYNDGTAVDFENDDFNSDSELYARWRVLGKTDADIADKACDGSYKDFGLKGVQLRTAQLGGMRYIASLSNTLLEELKALSGENPEYGFVAAREDNIKNWIDFADGRIDGELFELKYNGTNVNGTDTSAHSGNYQGFVKNIDCTASDYSSNSISDYAKYNKYRLYTFALTYSSEESAAMKDIKIAARAYLRYRDANGLLRFFFDSYEAMDAYGCCCVSLDDVSSFYENARYYSDISAMFADACNLTVENGTVSPDGAVCSMYLSGNKVCMTLLRDTSCADNLIINRKAEFSLNGKTLRFEGNHYLISYKDFKMFNGSYICSNAYYFSAHLDSAKIKNVSYTASEQNISFQGLYLGQLASSADDYIYNCGFSVNFDNTETFSLASLSDADKAVFKNCVYNLRTNADNAGAIYSQKNSCRLNIESCKFNIEQTEGNGTACAVTSLNSSSASVRNCEINLNSSNNVMGLNLLGGTNTITDTSFTAAGKSTAADLTSVKLYDANESDVITGCDFNFNGSYNAVSGVKYEQTDETNENCNLKFYNNSIKMELSALNNPKGGASGVRLSSSLIADINNFKADITVKSAMTDTVCAVLSNGSSKLNISGCDIKIKSTDKYAYSLRGIYAADESSVKLSDADIYAHALNDSSGNTCNMGILLTGSSSAVINEDDGPVFIKGGNAGIVTLKNSSLSISGGKYCSPTHGGAYIGGASADISGGTFYAALEDGFTNHGAIYATYNAVVNIDGAVLFGGLNGIRTRSNGDEPCSPVVNVSNCSIECTYSTGHLSCSAGTINNLGGNVFSQKTYR